jgi:hypothetical protein
MAELLLSRERTCESPHEGSAPQAIASGRGSSLNDEVPNLYTRLQELFDLRNQVARSGAAPDAEAAEEAVTTASDVFRWLQAHGA